MARILNITRGSFVVKDLGLPVEASIIKLKGIEVESGDGALVVNFNINDMEKSAIIQCFQDVNHIYAFGHDPESSGFSLSYLVYLGKKCMKDGKFAPGSKLKDIVDSYNAIKLSKGKATATISCGSGLSYVGIVLSLSASVHDPELNMISVTVAGKIVQ